jgi:uncharacterized RDD family membrane protein YckC
MNPSEAQPDSDSAATYFDPEEMDNSEEQFSASVETRPDRPRFVLNATEDLDGNALHHVDALSKDFSATNEDSALLKQIAQPLPEGTLTLGAHAASSSAHDWRDQVSAKVNSYKSRRPQKDRYPSLRLPFAPETRDPKTPTIAASLSSALNECSPTEEMSPKPRVPVLVEATARVLEFPRMAAPVRTDELADPVIDRPRIVEAPELQPPPPALGGILIEPVREPEPERRPGIDIPLQPATLSRRLLAAVVDLSVVSLALEAFGYIFFRINGTIPELRTLAELAAGLLAVLWPAYQYGFLVFTGTTPGLRLTRLQVSCFDGTLASRSLRRWRVLASLLSCFSLGLGYAWCFMDEDQLSWHDRITKTHLARR